MDAEIRKAWSWKFYRLALHLNTVILCIALTVLAGLLVPDPYRTPAVITLIVLDIILGYTFYKNYHATKAWLDEHGKTPEKRRPDKEQPA